MVCDKGLTLQIVASQWIVCQFLVLKYGAICWDSLKIHVGKVNARAICWDSLKVHVGKVNARAIY